MNEGESAGGGHQGSNPAPPAVPDRISTTTITSSNRIINTNNLKSASSTTPLSLAITADEQNSASLGEACTSPVPRSFQQAFAQHSLQPLPTTTTSTTEQQEQLQQQSLTHMPQTSSNRLTSSVTPTTTTAPTIRTDSSFVTAATNISDPSINTPLIKRKILDDIHSTAGGEITVLAPNICIVGSLLPTSHSHNCSLNKPSIATPDSNKLKNNPQALKKLILEQKYLRLRSLKEKHSENVAELFYLQTGGNMMDYPTWRKKPPTPQFITYSNAYRLDQLVSDERTSAPNTPNTTDIHTQQQQQPHQTADSIATIIGVVGHTQQPQQQQATQQTNTQSQANFSTTSSSTINNNNSLMVTTHGRTNIINGNNNNGCGNINSPAGTVSIAATHYGAAGIQSTILPTTTDASGNILPPQGAEIKIPAVGATPVAVSTKLPAAVQQLSQQGGTPLIPCSTAQGTTTLRRNGNSVIASNTPPPLYSPTPSGLLVPASSVNGSTVASASTTAANSAQEFSYKAKQEVDVMRRIMELQREGLWTEKRLPKQLEPARPKAHWDYLLEEMVWLAADFAQERKWKKAAAKKCAKMVQKYFQDKANAAQKAEKAQEAHLKRVAAFIAKEVKMFWSNVEKLVEYKHHTKLEEKRKKALDQHLSFIVDQTEKFSQQLAEGMNKSLVDASANPSINSSRISSPKRDNTDEEFRPESTSDDDEETIAKAEEEEAMDVDAEIAALEKESQMELNDVIKDLPKGYLENRDKILLEEQKQNHLKENDEGSTDSDDGEFIVNETSEDDENTISKQEAEEMDIDHQKEIDELEADNDLTVVELLARYTSTNLDNTDVEEKPKKSEDSKKMEIDDGSNGDDENEETIVKPSRDSDDESTADEESDDQDSEDEGDDLEEEGDEENTPEEEEADGLKSLFEDANVNSKDDMIKDAAALAESLQPKGNTLSSTNVVTPVPFLLKHTLREYQHIGLDWLVTMNERKLNGILADEMGLGKTIQTIALLAHLACVKGNWGPHLIVVPSSVMLNWEMEFKKWCPGFKILTYYGVQKERKMKRVGWTKPNAFHVCITSYKLVVQDQQSFRRKKWKYLILDEAQNIKNFKSQRWQLLLNFSTERRLLLTGTPLQNDLMELWSLMHFLMPYVFSSHREFKEWFSNPMTGMIEGNLEYNDQLIQRLHKVIRPFLLRRLKKEVEKQMPKKYEHVIMCRLSNRQRYLYDDFMSRAKTKETLQTGNLLSVINVLMQLRKVCNHPNMFEVRPTMSPFQMEGITYETSRLVCDLLDYDPFMQINLHTLNLLLIELELTLTAYVSHKSRLLAAPRKLIEEIDTAPQLPPRCPTGKYRFHVRVRDPKVQQNLRTHSSQAVRVGASPTMKTEGNKLVPVCGPASVDSSQSRINKRINHVINPLGQPKFGVIIPNLTTTTVTRSQVSNSNNSSTNTDDMGPTPAKIQKIGETAKSSTVNNSSGDAKLYIKAAKSIKDETALVSALVRQVKSNTSTRLSIYNNAEFKTEPSEIDDNCSELDSVYKMTEIFQQRKEKRFARLKLMATVNKRRTEATPIYGADCRESLEQCLNANHKVRYSTWHTRSYSNCCTAMARFSDNWTLNRIIKSYEKRCENLKQIFNNFVIYVPSVCAPRLRFYVRNLTSTNRLQQLETENTIQREMSTKLSILHPIISAMTTQFPDPRLIQYDCGKLQTLDRLLKQLKGDHHRILIFTQMTKMLDVLEAFLNYHGHIYLRLDGATKVEQRQILMERFNSDKRIFCFILSTRSGGVGINLTGADTVIFYDSDWNPTMDAQAQDRCHRIGQTRDVHIYRLVSEKTIEVNILKKANQKRMLSDMAIEGGNFTTSYFKSSTIKDLFNIDSQQQAVDSTTIAMATNASSCTQYQHEVSNSEMMVGGAMEIDLEKQSLKAFENALAAAEDEQDVQAAKTAKAEAAADLAEFDENIPLDETMATEGACNVELSKADLEMQNLVKQLSPIERYAMRFVEETGAAWTAEQLRAAEEEIEAQKREWEANRLAALQKEEEMLKQEAETAEELLTYSRKDATNQIWISSNTMEEMPMWCPPTPPQNDDDIYIDYSLSFMYEMEPIPEAELPPIYVKKDYKRSRGEAGFLMDGSRRPTKIRREEMLCAPRSLFDRPSAAIARIRRDLKNQRYRGIFKPNVQIPGLKPQISQKPLTEPENMAEWSIFEDMIILHVLVNLQALPCNLMLLSPGHTPNWDLVAEIVNSFSKTYRSPKQCRWRYEAVIQPREEGKLVESPKKQKKLKGAIKSEYLKGSLRCLRTTQMYANDNNTSFSKIMRTRFECIRSAYLKKAPPPKRHFSTPSLMNPKHMEVLQEFGIVNYDQPILPQTIAIMRSNKIREKQRAQCPSLPPPTTQAPACITGVSQQPCGITVSTPISVVQHQAQQSQTQQQLHELVQQQQVAVAQTPILHSQQLQIQHITPSGVQQQQQQQQQHQQQQPTATAIVLQHAVGSNVQQSHNTSAGIVQQSTQQHLMSRHPTSATQIVKAIVSPQSSLLTSGQVQQLQHQTTNTSTTGQSQHIQLQQQQSSGNLAAPASVSVVLTTPVQTISSNVQQQQHHNSIQSNSSAAQIVSLSPQQTIVSSSPQVGSIVQTQALPQVVSVSQLATVGTVLTTSSSLGQPTGTVTTLNTSALRAQRIVAAPTGTTLQDVVLQQRSAGNPSPTIVSMSSLGSNVTQAQFQAAQLQLASMPAGAQQVVTKLRVGSLQQGGKITTTSPGNTPTGQQPTHIQLYRQRQQLKVLQAATTGQAGQQTVVQTASGQTALVNASGTIIQGSIVPTNSGSSTVQVVQQGQKVAVATSNVSIAAPNGSSGGSGVTTVAAGQVHSQQSQQSRAQFIKQVNAVTGKQTIARQVGDTDMLLVKRQVTNSAVHQKAAQMLQQGQIFTTTSTGGMQIQQTATTAGVVAGTTLVQQQQQTIQNQGQKQQMVQQVTPQQIATLVKTSAVTSAGVGVTPGNSGAGQAQSTVNMALSQLKPGGQIKVTMANQSQMRQLHMQQHLGMPRKISRMTQIAAATGGSAAVSVIATQQSQQNQGTTITQTSNVQQQQQITTTVAQKTSGTNTGSVGNSSGVQTQLVHIQNTKSLPSSVTVQQIQQVMRQGQPGFRVIPVSMASQPNQRQAIQVVSATSAQALAAGNLRAHIASGQNIAGTIKVTTAGGSQSQTQQAIITAIQQQAAAQQNQRPSASPVRLQTTVSGNLVAVVQQQSLQQQQTQQQQSTQNVAVSTSSGVNANINTSNTSPAEVMTITQTSTGAAVNNAIPQPLQTSQQATTQQVRTLVKKKIMQIRSEKE
ncbi:helicase domino isoform X1 [Glossina fuscipes]|uniref:Helicase domino isoform X1 n=1 Tax=Glossina fuscipes TaxID=7396 RepID=A0A9C5ZB30_9MUSC|nr:helicase domino isoform X1 [Glossina fuscipes]